MQKRRERLAGRAPVQALERTVVEHAVDPPHLLVQDGVERTAPGQDLAHDAVSVLVRPALPRMVRLREVDLDPERLIELLEEVELLAVVRYQKFLIIEAIAKPAAASAVSSKPPYLFRENRCNSGRAASTMPPL